MTKEELIKEIYDAFKGVRLEDGIGLWEAQGLDDYADPKTMAELRKKDERNNILEGWKQKINCSNK